MDPKFDLIVSMWDSSEETYADMTEMPPPKADREFNVPEMQRCNLQREETLSSNKYQQRFIKWSYRCVYVSATKKKILRKHYYQIVPAYPKVV